MRGKVEPQGTLFTTISPEKRVPAEHPIRKIKALVDEQLRAAGVRPAVSILPGHEHGGRGVGRDGVHEESRSPMGMRSARRHWRCCDGCGGVGTRPRRKRVEEIFGWMKTVGGFRRTRYQDQARTQTAGYFVAAAYNLVRMCRLMATPA